MIYIGGLGKLERFILPPVTGRSVSFRLRFRFVRVVRAVRAGEAKLRGRMQTVLLIAGPPGCEYPGACGRLFAYLLCTGAWVRMVFLCFLWPRACFLFSRLFLDADSMGFKILRKCML